MRGQIGVAAPATASGLIASLSCSAARSCVATKLPQPQLHFVDCGPELWIAVLPELDESGIVLSGSRAVTALLVQLTQPLVSRSELRAVFSEAGYGPSAQPVYVG
jgi:hypothetical protein